MDLTQSYPRSIKERLAGVAGLARTTDKAKAAAAGTNGEYNYNCPLDQRVLGFLGIDADAFLDNARNAKDDAKVESYAKPFVDKKTPAELETFNRELMALSPEPGSEAEKYFLELRNTVAPDRTDVTTWPDLLDLEEKREVPRKVTV
jgi:hypothetical protein